MKIQPSVIQNVQDNSLSTQKKTKLEDAVHEILVHTQPAIDGVYAGKSTERKHTIRPVMLVMMYPNDLWDESSDVKYADKIGVDGKTLVQIDMQSKNYIAAELSGAIKDSIKAERALIQRLEIGEMPERCKVVITNETYAFGIGRERLMGEILKVHRKIERIRPLYILDMQKSLENMLRKLCVMKILSDREQEIQEQREADNIVV